MTTDPLPTDDNQQLSDENRQSPNHALELGDDLEPFHRVPQPPVVPHFADDRDSDSGRWSDSYFASGCLIPALVLGVVVVALVALGLFLPPVSLWETIDKQINDAADSGEAEAADTFMVEGLTFTALDAKMPDLTAGGLTIGAAPSDLNGEFGLHVKALDPADYLAGNLLDAGWHCAADLPSGYALASRVYSLTQSGTPPESVHLELNALPENADSGALELHVWDAARGEWRFVPASPAEKPFALAAALPVVPRCVALFRTVASARAVGVAFDLQDTFAPDVMAANVQLYTGSIRPTASGALNIILAPGVELGQGYDVVPLVQNFDSPAVIDVATVDRILGQPALRTEHARQIAAFVLAQEGYAGAAIDYRAIPPERGEDYVAFLRELADLLHSQDRTLTVILPVPHFDGETWQADAYDWVATGQIADHVVITLPLDPRAYTPDGTVDSLLVWATTQIARSKLLLGLDARTVAEFGDHTFAPVTLDEALAYMGDIQADVPQITTGQTVTMQLIHPAQLQTTIAHDAGNTTITYRDAEGNLLRTMHLTDPGSLYARLIHTKTFNLGGVFVWNLMSPDVVPGVANALLAYRLDQPFTASPDTSLIWTARAGETVMAEETRQPGEAFTFQAPAEGAITVEVRFFTGHLIASRDLTVSPAQLQPTPAPTSEPAISPTPTLEPTLAPTVAPTLAPTTETAPEPTSTSDVQPLPTLSPAETPAEVPAETPAEAAAETPVETPVAAPTEAPAETPAETPPETQVAIAVTETPVEASSQPQATPEPTVDAFPTATPPPGVVPLDLAQPLPAVDPAILAGADVGSEFEAGAHLGGMSPAILQVGRMGLTWVKFDVRYQLGQSPAFYANAIAEAQANGFKVLLNVTGDPFEFTGTDRALYLGGYVAFVGELAALDADGIEVWHSMNGRLTPEEYVQLLAYAYHAIKTANPDTLVITGALRPSADPATPEENDATYATRLGEIGVAQYADCIGVNYTLGAVPPASTSGDPRGDSPIYYLASAAERAGQTTNGALPLCYTRLGYLAPEGYPALPPDYAWAQPNTAGQQAQWLADAIRLSRDSAQVRLLIIWSLEASYFGGGSPEEGYAIIRPDGSCPACELITPLFETP